MAEKSIIIIGAGIAGLCAGCYARMNGYRTTIFELHDKPGGLCTSWNRKGYTIDGCLHWLVGSAPDDGFHPLWNEVGALQGKQIINMDQFFRIEGPDGKVFNVYSDIDRLEQHMKEIAPEDAGFITECMKSARHFTKMKMPVTKAPELYSPFDTLKLIMKMLPFFGDLKKYGKMTMRDFALRFKNPLLREAWLNILYPGLSATAIIMTLAWLHQKNAGYVVGGSMEISHSVEKRYLGLGGEIKYKSRVEKILVENDRAIGVRLEDGSEHRADYVISAADGHATIFEMLDGRYVNEKIRGYYQKLPIFEPLIYIGLGVNRTFDDLPKIISGLVIHLEKPVVIADQEQKWLHVRIHNFDPTLAPEGKTVLTVMMDSNFPYWKTLREHSEDYHQEKELIGKTIINLLDKRFPGLAGQVEMVDVATPVTFNRYTGNWQGSFEGWLITPQTINMRMSKTLPGLGSFYMAGQWVEPGGGLPSGIMSGRNVMQCICKQDKKRFVTTTP